MAEVIRSCWESYNRAHALAPHVVKAVGHILRCRTAALGGHIHRCDTCGSEVPLYNSCQTRHCPSCQTHAKEEWLDARLTEVLRRNGWRAAGSGSSARRRWRMPSAIATCAACARCAGVANKIRYFGWMAAANRKETLAAIRQSLHVDAPPAPVKESLTERLLRKTGVDITLCPHCGQGHLHKTDRLLAPYRGQAP